MSPFSRLPILDDSLEARIGTVLDQLVDARLPQDVCGNESGVAIDLVCVSLGFGECCLLHLVELHRLFHS
jgi:hypothetical protein